MITLDLNPLTTPNSFDLCVLHSRLKSWIFKAPKFLSQFRNCFFFNVPKNSKQESTLFPLLNLQVLFTMVFRSWVDPILQCGRSMTSLLIHNLFCFGRSICFWCCKKSMDRPKEKKGVDRPRHHWQSTLYVQKSERNFGKFMGVICHGNNMCQKYRVAIFN